MPDSKENYGDTYRALVQRLLRPIGKRDGYAEGRIAIAERRLGLQLPSRLREFCRLVGRRTDINEVFHRLLPPEDIYLSDDTLVFYEENQGTCLWGVAAHDTDRIDPAVRRQDQTDSPIWESDYDHLSEFFRSMFFLQAVNGGMTYCGVGSVASTHLRQASIGWENITLGGGGKNRVLLREGKVLYLFEGDSALPVLAGAQTRKEFRDLENTFAPSWDYCTPDDE